MNDSTERRRAALRLAAGALTLLVSACGSLQKTPTQPTAPAAITAKARSEIFSPVRPELVA